MNHARSEPQDYRNECGPGSPPSGDDPSRGSADRRSAATMRYHFDCFFICCPPRSFASSAINDEATTRRSTTNSQLHPYRPRCLRQHSMRWRGFPSNSGWSQLSLSPSPSGLGVVTLSPWRCWPASARLPSWCGNIARYAVSCCERCLRSAFTSNPRILLQIDVNKDPRAREPTMRRELLVSILETNRRSDLISFYKTF